MKKNIFVVILTVLAPIIYVFVSRIPSRVIPEPAENPPPAGYIEQKAFETLREEVLARPESKADQYPDLPEYEEQPEIALEKPEGSITDQLTSAREDVEKKVAEMNKNIKANSENWTLPDIAVPEAPEIEKIQEPDIDFKKPPRPDMPSLRNLPQESLPSLIDIPHANRITIPTITLPYQIDNK